MQLHASRRPLSSNTRRGATQKVKDSDGLLQQPSSVSDVKAAWPDPNLDLGESFFGQGAIQEAPFAPTQRSKKRGSLLTVARDGILKSRTNAARQSATNRKSSHGSALDAVRTAQSFPAELRSAEKPSEVDDFFEPLPSTKEFATLSSLDPIPSSMLVGGLSGGGSASLHLDDDSFFNPVPAPVGPSALAASPFSNPLDDLENGIQKAELKGSHLKELEEGLFNSVPSPAGPGEFAGDELWTAAMRMHEQQALNPVAMLSQTGGTFHNDAATRANSKYTSGSASVEPSDQERITSPAKLNAKPDILLDASPAEGSSLVERLLEHITGAVQTTSGNFTNFAYFFQIPGLFIIAAATVSSVFALLVVGRKAHQNEIMSIKRNRPVDHEFIRVAASPKAPMVDSDNFGPQHLDPSSPFAEALMLRAPVPEPPPSPVPVFRRPPVPELSSSALGSDNLGSLSESVPMQPRILPTPSKCKGNFTPDGQALTAAHYLCPGLVVPPECECIFAVPAINGTSSDNIVFDLTGKPALKLNVTLPDWTASNGLEQNPLVVLHSFDRLDEQGKTVPAKTLAFCKIEHYAAEDVPLRDRAYIYDAHGVLFGTLSAWSVQNQCYTMTSVRSSIELSLEGDFAQHMVNVWSGSRQLVGDSSPSCHAAFDREGKCWRLRVLANMDAGLLLIALLCAEIIEGKHGHNPHSFARTEQAVVCEARNSYPQSQVAI